MTRKADFNAEEWSTLVEAPVLASMRVVTAGRGGTIRESMALGKVYAAVRQEQGESELLDDLVASPPAMDPARIGSTGDIKGVAEERLREAVGILEAKATPEELDAYRSFVVTLAEAVASAHKEGGFLGVGGTRVSEDEQRALDEIAATLRGAADA
jgi:head-tail adaptor